MHVYSAAPFEVAQNSESAFRTKAIVPVDNRGVRICLDYNGTSNVDYPGGPQLDHFSLDATSSILDCLRSTERRKALKVQVWYLNRWLELRGIPSSQFVALNITTSRTKEDLSADICHSHLDDKWGRYLACESKVLTCICSPTVLGLAPSVCDQLSCTSNRFVLEPRQRSSIGLSSRCPLPTLLDWQIAERPRLG